MRLARLVAGALVLVALALRLWHLEFQSLWWDEGVSIYLAGAGLRALTVGKDFGVDLHPPGYHLLLAAWQVVAGPSVFADRLLSVFAGALTVPLTFRLVGQLVPSQVDTQKVPLTPTAGERKSWRRSPIPRLAGGVFGMPPTAAPALLAAGLAVASPIDVFYSQETRMYALLPLLGTLSLSATLRVARVGSTRAWVFWVILNVVGWYVYYYLVLLTIAEAVVLLASSAARGTLGAWMRAQVALVALYLPWLILLTRLLRTTSLALPPETTVHPTPLRYLLENWEAFTVGFTMPPGHLSLLALWLLVVGVGGIALARRSPLALVLLVLALLVPLAGAGAVLLVRPFFYPRFILFVLPALWTLAGFGLAVDRRWLASALLVVPLLAGNGWTWSVERTSPRTGYAPDDYRQLLATLASFGQPGDLVLCGYPWQAGYVAAYLPALYPRVQYVPRAEVAKRLGELRETARRAWVFSYSPDHRFADDPLETALGATWPTALVDQNGDARIRLFQRDAPPAEPAPAAPTFGGQIALAEGKVAAASSAIRPGSQLDVVLRWQALARPTGSYTAFVHALGPDGKVWGQRDSPPLGGTLPTPTWTPGEIVVDRYTLVVDSAAPAGRYEVEVGLYRPETGQRLTVGSVPRQGDRIVVGVVVVARP